MSAVQRAASIRQVSYLEPTNPTRSRDAIVRSAQGGRPRCVQGRPSVGASALRKTASKIKAVRPQMRGRPPPVLGDRPGNWPQAADLSLLPGAETAGAAQKYI